jgi:hypothetical protein
MNKQPMKIITESLNQLASLAIDKESETFIVYAVNFIADYEKHQVKLLIRYYLYDDFNKYKKRTKRIIINY